MKKTKTMFTNFFQYFFMFNGLPVYCPDQSTARFTLWYFWRVSIVIRYNIDLIYFVHRMIYKWVFPYSLFGFTDIAVLALTMDSLIGKHRRLIGLQKFITDQLNNGSFIISRKDKCKMRALQAFFGLTLFLSAFTLVFSLYEFRSSDIVKETENFVNQPLNWFYVLFISITSWVTTISSALYYCMFCKHLKAMFSSTNRKTKKLGKTLEKKRIKDEYHCSLNQSWKQNIKSRGNRRAENYPVFPSALSFSSNDPVKKENDLTQPRVKSAKTLRKILKGLKSNLKKKKLRRISCSTILEIFTDIKNHPLQFPTKTDSSSSKDVKKSNYLARKIQHLNKKFAFASLLVQEADNLFSFQVLAILTITFLRTCCYIYVYVSSNWKMVDKHATLSLVQQIFFDFVAFGSVAMEASLVAEEAKKFTSIMIKTHDIYKSNSIKVQVQSDITMMTAYSFDVQLTAWKFFTVSRSFVPTVIGVTATYIIIILQLLQIVQEKQCESFRNETDVLFINSSSEFSPYMV